MLKGKGKFNVYGSKAVISISSVVWKDSQFPFKKGEELKIEIVGEELRVSKIKKAKRKRKIVLVVDDEKEIQELIKEYLLPLSIEIYPAYNGLEAIQLYKELMEKGKKPDLVIMDLNLSGSNSDDDLIKQIRGEEMDGVRTANEIRKIDPSVNIVGFSAFAHLEWGKRLKAVGAIEVFGREIGFDRFARRISELLP